VKAKSQVLLLWMTGISQWPRGWVFIGSFFHVIAVSVQRRLFRLLPLAWLACICAGAQPSAFVITTIAGGGSRTGNNYACGPISEPGSNSNSPLGLARDKTGNLIVAEYSTGRICEISAGGDTKVLASGIGSDPSVIASAVFITVDKSGNIYFFEQSNLDPPRGIPLLPSRIRKLSADGNITTLIEAETSGLAVDESGNLYFSPTRNTISRVSPSGTVSVFAGGVTGFSGDGGPAIAASLNGPGAMTFDSSGDLIFVDTGNSRFRKVTPNGIISTVSLASADITSIAVDNNGNLLATAGKTISRIDTTGASIIVVGGGIANADGGPAADVALVYASSIVADSVGDAYFTDGTSVRELFPSPPSIGCLYGVQANQTYFHQAGGSGVVSIATSASGCPWAVSNHSDWVTIQKTGVAGGNAMLDFTVAPNVSAAGRSTQLWLAGQDIAIAQDGATCTNSLQEAELTIAAIGQSGAVAISTNLPDCTWMASSDVDWIKLGGNLSGTGDGSVAYTVLPNPGQMRTGIIKIGGQSFTVVQVQIGVSIPSISSSGIVNAASGIGAALAPGEFISIYGFGIGPSNGISGFQRGLSGTSVFINGTEALVAYASNSQVNALVPYGIELATPAQVQVVSQTIPSNTVSVPVGSTSPGIFTVDGSGTGEAVIVNEDGSLNSPLNPARAGSIITFFATGQGLTTPRSQDGEPPIPPVYPKPEAPILVSIGGLNVRAPDILFFGLVYEGIMQVNVRLPTGITTAGTQELILNIGGVSSRTGVTLAVN